LIRTEHLTKYYGTTRAVEDLSFEVKEGQTLILLGTSGCGKTTVLKMLNRLVEPTRGEIYIDDSNIMQADPDTLRRKIGYVIQEVGLFPHYTVRDNVAVVPYLLKWSYDRVYERVDELLSQMGLPPEEYAGKYPHELSGGEQQRVGVARAVAADPPIVLMDEPFGALDLITRKKMRQEFMQLEVLQQKTIVLVTHDVSEAIELGDNICLMNEGQLQQMGTARELLFQPANGFVADFFDADRYELGLQVIQLKDLPQKQIAVSTSDEGESFKPNQTLADVMSWYGQAARSPETPVEFRHNSTAVHTNLSKLLDSYNHLLGKVQQQA
jgi:osmoprotectant transport system ATP-binding protein